MRVRWLIATALAYGLFGGYLLFSQIWDVNGGLAWTRTATERLGWAAAVFLVSTVVLARRHPERGGGWIALHAAVAFLLGAAVAWATLEYLMRGAEHPWDTDIPDSMLYCIDCARRAPMIRQTLLATLAGTLAVCVTAPLVARTVRPGALSLARTLRR